MSEFTKITVREEPGKFAGLDSDVALKRAEECLKADDLEIVRRKLSGEGKSIDEIAAEMNYSRDYVLDTVERAKVEIANHHITKWEPMSHAEQTAIMRSASNGIRKYGRQ